MMLRNALLALLALGVVRPAAAFVLSGIKWPQSGTTFHVEIARGSGLRVAPSGITWNAAFEQAMQAWSDATVFHFSSIRNPPVNPCAEEGRNGAGFRSSVCGRAFGSGVLAVTLQTFTRDGAFVETDIIFNDKLDWDVYRGPVRGEAEDFRRVAVHELGHAIGLEHENGARAIMAGVIGDLEVPQSDDIDGVNTLYAGPAPTPVPCPVPKALGPTATTGGELTGGDCTLGQILPDFVDASLVDQFRVTLPATGTFTVTMRSSALDAYLLLADDGLNDVLAQHDDLNVAAGNTDARITEHLNAGAYRVIATSFPGESGPYILETRFSTPALSQPRLVPAVTVAGASSLAEFLGGASADGGLSYASTFTATDAIDVVANIVVAPDDVGATGAVFVVAIRNGLLLQKGADGQFKPWDGSLARLEPALSRTAFGVVEQVEVVRGLTGLAGEFAVFVGYRGRNGAIHYHANPIRFTVRPPQ